MLCLGQEGQVDGQVGGIHLLDIVDWFFALGRLVFIGGDQDDVVTRTRAVLSLTVGLVLQALLIGQVVQDTISSHSHNDLLQISCLTLLQLLELLVRESLYLVLEEVFFLANEGSLVSVLKRVVVVGETLNQLIFVILLLYFTSAALNERPAEDKGKEPKRSRVVSHEGGVHVLERGAHVMV